MAEKHAESHVAPPPEELALRGAVRDLYRVFHPYPLARAIDGCPHCTSGADDAVLRSKPLGDLSASDLSRFGLKAMTTLGTETDFKHFLPRLFELAADGSLTRELDPQVLFGKLAYANWRRWPAKERRAVEAYCYTLWRATLAQYPRNPPADECLCCLGTAFDDVGPFLAEWLSRLDGLAAVRHLAEFAELNYEAVVTKRRLWDAFWERRDAQVSQVLEWLAHPALAAKVEAAFHTYRGTDCVRELSDAVTHLETMAAALRA